MPAKKKPRSTYKPAARDTTSVELPPELNELIEELARNNHDNWAAQRIKEGWRLGSKRDDRAKTHPCLVPYAELPESEKELDRRAAVETLKSIMQLDFRIVPPESSKEQTASGSTENGAASAGELSPLLSQLLERLGSDRSLTTQEIAHAWRVHDPEEWRAHPEIYRSAGRFLIQRGDNILAQEILSEARRLRSGDDAVMDYLLALALARSGALERAGDVARQVQVVGINDLDLLEDMLSLPGRIYKDLARSARNEQQRQQYLQGAFEAYSAAFRPCLQRLNPLWEQMDNWSSSTRIQVKNGG